QSYGGIDGDSASAAEIICLLSALTNAPLRQDLAMTGAIDQLGNVLPVGAINEKIEGFFDTCMARGSCSSHGVLIPKANVGDLMLRTDVVEAAAAGTFHVHAVSHIGQAMQLLMGRPLGDGSPECLIRLARERSHEFWRMGARRPEG
ncbi:MAG: hypothetical protein KDA21_00165, partial [Phycisphaerales bacterium]|nr:hypothetical protein [Phycisphaerales bacterium]